MNIQQLSMNYSETANALFADFVSMTEDERSMSLSILNALDAYKDADYSIAQLSSRLVDSMGEIALKRAPTWGIVETALEIERCIKEREHQEAIFKMLCKISHIEVVDRLMPVAA